MNIAEEGRNLWLDRVKVMDGVCRSLIATNNSRRTSKEGKTKSRRSNSDGIASKVVKGSQQSTFLGVAQVVLGSVQVQDVSFVRSNQEKS